MTRIDNLAASPGRRTSRRLDRLDRAAPTGRTSITVGQLRLAGILALLLEGTGKVTGTLYIDGPGGGVLDVTGVINASGRVNIDSGGRLVVSEAGDSSHSMQVLYDPADGFGKVIGFGIPVELRAWDATIRLEEGGVQINGGDGQSQVLLSGSDVTVKTGSGAEILLANDAVEIKQGDGPYILMTSNTVVIKNNSGPGIELRDGSIYLTDVPTS